VFLEEAKLLRQKRMLLCDELMRLRDKLMRLCDKLMRLRDKLMRLCDKLMRLRDELMRLCDRLMRLCDKLMRLCDELMRLRDELMRLCDELMRLCDGTMLLCDGTMLLCDAKTCVRGNASTNVSSQIVSRTRRRLSQTPKWSHSVAPVRYFSPQIYTYLGGAWLRSARNGRRNTGPLVWERHLQEDSSARGIVPES